MKRNFQRPLGGILCAAFVAASVLGSYAAASDGLTVIPLEEADSDGGDVIYADADRDGNLGDEPDDGALTGLEILTDSEEDFIFEASDVNDFILMEESADNSFDTGNGVAEDIEEEAPGTSPQTAGENSTGAPVQDPEEGSSEASSQDPEEGSSEASSQDPEEDSSEASSQDSEEGFSEASALDALELEVISVEEVSAEDTLTLAAGGTVGLGVTARTRDEIVAYLQNSGATFSDFITYAEEPVCQTPYNAGVLSDATKSSALAMLNNVRYIAGLSSNVTLRDSYGEVAQAGALVSAANGGINHTPPQPDGMDDALYQLGYTGCGNSNLGAGYANLNMDIVHGWMNDGSVSNISTVGHRRWILNPSMGQTGFGAVTGANTTYSSYYTMYAFDLSNSSAAETKVAWPAQVMPLEYFGSSYPWSISIGSTVTASAVEVTLTRRSDQTSWKFSSDSSDGDFYVNNGNYGQTGCIIFRPNNITYADGDVFDVTITGLSDTISYSVSFFELDPYWHSHDYTYRQSTSWDCEGLTCTVTYFCECGETLTKTYPLSVTVQEPTCTVNGTKTYRFTDIYSRTFSKPVTVYAPGHTYGGNWTDQGDHTVTAVCDVCGQTNTVGVVTAFTAYWRNAASTSSTYSTAFSKTYLTGDKLLYQLSPTAGGNDSVTTLDQSFVVESSDSSVISVTQDSTTKGTLTMRGPGTATITIYPRLNPSLKKTYSISVNHMSYFIVSLGTTGYTYDGTAKTPSVAVTSSGLTLTQGTDYTVSYSNNQNAGTATATITGTGNYTGSVTRTFTISKAAQTISATLTPATIQIGETARVSASAPGGLTYRSSNTAVASVDASGLITGKSEGTATITVSAAATTNYTAASQTFTVTVTRPPAASQETESSNSGQTSGSSGQTSAGSSQNGSQTSANGGSQNGSQSSSTSSGGSQNGSQTSASNGGSQTSSASNGGSQNASQTSASNGGSQNGSQASASNGGSQNGSQTSASNGSSQNGSQTSASNGDSQSSSTGSQNGSQNASAQKVSQTITAKLSSSSIQAGKKATIKASAKGKLTYKSANTKIATVSAAGVVTGKSAGKTKITITAAATGNYKAATKTVTVTVTPKPVLKVNATTVTLQKKKSTQGLKVTMIDGDSISSVKSGNTKVVQASIQNKKTGVIKLTAKNKTGSAKVTIKLKSGLSKTITVKVQSGKVKTTKITLPKKTITLKKGKTYKLAPTLTPFNSQEKITYTSSNKKIAAVSSSGKITAKKKGTAKITVKSGSKKAVVTVKVS